MSQAVAMPTAGRHGLYRFDPGRDLRHVARLLSTCFVNELDAQDKRWLADLGAMTGGGAVLGIALRLMPDARGILTGFVWYEQGRLVGNVSLMRITARAWAIANVGTHPSHRRRGIGRRLMLAAIDHVREHGGTLVGLQVRSDNLAAVDLYRDLGFVYAGRTEAYRLPLALDSDAPLDASGRLRSWDARDAVAVRSVLARAGAGEGPWPAGPIIQSLVGETFLHRLDDWLRGREAVRQLIEVEGIPRGVAVTYRERRTPPHVIELAVEPEATALAGPLIDAALREAAGGAPGAVIAETPTPSEGLAVALGERRFRHERSLDRLLLHVDD